MFGLRSLESYFSGADLLYTSANAAGKLQRHWTELFLKTAINIHASISSSLRELEKHALQQGSTSAVGTARLIHGLDDLRKDLKSATTTLNISIYPADELDPLVDAFEVLEQKTPEVWRYDYVPTVKNQPQRRNFAIGTVIDLKDIQNRIRDVKAKHIDPDPSFLRDLSDYNGHLDQELYAAGLLK